MVSSRVAPREVKWNEWSTESFEKAANERKLVLLDLFAPWCHWCHVMDERTYSDPEVIDIVNESFIPVRVDIDQRPDISERYNRGGFPTTTFLSDRGESVWGATYVPPDDMKRVMKQILAAKESGDVDQALERDRMQFLDVGRALERKEMADNQFADAVFEDIFSTYDVQWGGFGAEQKFPHPDVIDLLLVRYAQNNDRELADAVANTLDHMTDGLYDKVGGGVFRYSVTRNWKEPHFEKMLETNLGFLRNLVRARRMLGHERFAETARGVADYLLRVLRDSKTGSFFSSQDADEKYYGLPQSERSRAKPPKVVTDFYSGWNCEAASTFIEAGVMLNERKWVDAGKNAWLSVLDRLWDPDRSLVRHRSGNDLFLFEDQVSFLEALRAMIELASEDDIPRLLELGDASIKAIEETFAHPEGGYGDVAPGKDAIGELAEARRSIAANAKFARALALFGMVEFKPERSSAARAILDSFHPKQIQANGLFAAPYVLAWWVIDRGPRLVEVHGIDDRDVTSEPLWSEAKMALDSRTVVMRSRQTGPEVPSPRKPFAVICGPTGCSKEVEDPRKLSEMLREAGEVKSK